MKNRIVENWLINANELTFQLPFCQILQAKGFKIVHISRHGPLEQGKDIIAINKEGIPCAFQLKGNDINLTRWREEVRAEIEELVEIRINHPSINDNTKHKCYLVTNGNLADEVVRELDDRNRAWENKGYSKVETWVKDQLLGDFQEHYGAFLPSSIEGLADLFNLYSENGTFPLDKVKYVALIESILDITQGMRKGSQKSLQHAMSGSVILASYALQNKYKSENHIAIIDGLIILLSCILRLVERNNLDKKYWKDTTELIFKAIEIQFYSLIAEVKLRKDFVEGSALEDGIVYKARVTLVSGYLASFYLYKLFSKEVIDEELKNTIVGFYNSTKSHHRIYCEGMLPGFINTAYMFQSLGYKDITEEYLQVLLVRLLLDNTPFKGEGMPDPYHSVEDSIRWLLRLKGEIQEESFRGRSYYLKPLVYVLCQRDSKQFLADNWKSISNIQYVEIKLANMFDFFKHISNDAEEQSRFPEKTQSWNDLKHTIINNSANFPYKLKEFPQFIPLFLILFPHRYNLDIALYLNALIEMHSE